MRIVLNISRSKYLTIIADPVYSFVENEEYVELLTAHYIDVYLFDGAVERQKNHSSPALNDTRGSP